MSKHNGRNETREIESAELIRLHAENAKLKREMEQLRLVSQLGVEQPELRPFAKQLAKLAAECLDTTQAWIGLIEDDVARVLAFYHDGETHTPDALTIPLSENLSGLVWHKRHAALVVDAAHDPAIPEAFRREFDCRSALCVPMMDYRNEILGVIQWHNRSDGLPFTEADVAMGEAVAMQSTVAFERSRSHSHMLQWLGAIENLFAFNTVMNERLDPNVLVKRLVEYACGFLGADGGLAGLTRESHLHASSYFNGNAWLPINRCWEMHEGAPGWVAMSRCPYLSNEYADDLHADREWLTRFNVCYVICVPIVDADSQMLGFVELHKHKGRSPFTWMDASFLESLANITAIAINNARLVGALETNRAQATALSAQHVTWMEDERRRLARELHDETGQALIGIKLGLQAVASKAGNDGAELRRQLDHLREQVNQAALRLKATARMLRPPTLDELGLDSALRQLALDFQTSTNTAVDVYGGAEMRLPPMIETACYRIAQEALTNAVKHGSAQHVRIELVCHAHLLTLSIEDDGTGFDQPAQTTNGLGLPGMKERAVMLGGTLTLHSSPMRGTHITVRIPLDQVVPTDDAQLKIHEDVSLKPAHAQTAIILVDDHALVRRGLAALLQSDGRYKVVAEARDGEEALACAANAPADVMLLDLSMPRLNGLETLRRLRESGLSLQVVVVSMYDDEQFVAQAFRNGANGYILKQSLEDELFHALHAVEHSERYVSPLIQVSWQTIEASPGASSDLTRREREVLQLIADGRTTQQIADALVISWHTANRHRANIMHKLGAHHQVDLVRTATRLGLVAPSAQGAPTG